MCRWWSLPDRRKPICKTWKEGIPKRNKPVRNPNRGKRGERSAGFHSLHRETIREEPSGQEPQTIQTNENGWDGLTRFLGLEGFSEVMSNPGSVLAMLPDMLLGIFTGKTQSLGLKENLLPIASIVAGIFVKNPMLKMLLIGLGGANLLNKAGHEALGKKGRRETEMWPRPTKGAVQTLSR